MKYSLACIAACLVGTAAAASAQTSAPTTATPPETTVTAPAKSKPKRVCRERQRSGSHLSNIVCKTPEQWAELQEQLDTEAELGIPGNKTASGRAVDRGVAGGSPGNRPGPN